MRFLLVCSTLVPVAVAACGGVSEYPPGTSGDEDASADASGFGSSSSSPATSSGSSGSSSGANPVDAGSPVLDAGEHLFDASHHHDAAGVDAGPVDGVCPKACTDEPTGVPPCTAPERSCNCPVTEPAPVGCAPVAGLAGVYCCES